MVILKIGAQVTRHLLQDLIDFASLHVLLDQTADSLKFLVFGVLDQLEQHGLGCGNRGTGRPHPLWGRIKDISAKRGPALYLSIHTYSKCNVDFWMILGGNTVSKDMNVNVVFEEI